MTAPSPWLSVVTVVKDDSAGFAATRASLLGQDLDGVEWVVIDGSATAVEPDGPPELAVHYAWEPPAGVYAAMNSGLKRTRGDYVYFLNAGDRLHAPTTLRDVRALLGTAPLWLVGEVRFMAGNRTYVQPSPLDYATEQRRHFAAGRFPPHQGTVVRTEALRGIGGFDTSFRIAADYDVALAMSRMADPVLTSMTIADFAEGGVSAQEWTHAIREFHRARISRLDLHGAARAQELVRTARHASLTSLARLRDRLRGRRGPRT